MLEIDKEIFEYRQKEIKGVEEMAIKCAHQLGEYEHTFHNTKETLGIELAKLEALKEVMANDVTTYKKLLDEKNKEIERLNTLCLKMAENKGVVVQK
ncbi:MAG: hypothetical protein WC333_00060 [Dehalococcoidia bacterium]